MKHLPRPNLEPLYSHHRQLSKAERFSKLSSQCLYALQQDPAEQSDPRSLEWFAADQGAAYRSSFVTILQDIEDFLEAQKLIDKAFHAPYGHADRVTFAERANEISPQYCLDSWNLLAEEKADTVEEALKYYEKAVEYGRAFYTQFQERKLPAEAEVVWCPFQRSLGGMASCLFKLGRYAECLNAIDELWGLVDEETANMAPIAWRCCLELERFDHPCLTDIESKKHKLDGSRLYTAFLLKFKRATESEQQKMSMSVDDLLLAALDRNVFTAMLLLKDGTIAAETIPYPNVIHPGYLSESVAYVQLFGKFFQDDPCLLKCLRRCYITNNLRHGWTAKELSSHCLMMALHASFNGRLSVEDFEKLPQIKQI